MDICFEILVCYLVVLCDNSISNIAAILDQGFLYIVVEVQ